MPSALSTSRVPITRPLWSFQNALTWSKARGKSHHRKKAKSHSSPTFFPKKYCLPSHFNLDPFTFKRGSWMRVCSIGLFDTSFANEHQWSSTSPPPPLGDYCCCSWVFIWHWAAKNPILKSVLRLTDLAQGQFIPGNDILHQTNSNEVRALWEKGNQLCITEQNSHFYLGQDLFTSNRWGQVEMYKEVYCLGLEKVEIWLF